MPKIMLAEDDPTALSLLKTIMKMVGFETASLNEQENVLEALLRENPDVLLLDVHLTQGNGVDFLRLIRSEPKLDNVFIIMQSGDYQVDEECKVAGADAFLYKPYSPDTLIDTIKAGLINKK